MSNRFEGERDGAETGRSSPGVVRLLGQMMMLPLTVFVYGMELFVRTVQGMQSVAEEGVGVMAGQTAQTQNGIPTSEGLPTNYVTVNEGVQAPGATQGNLSDSANQTTTSNDGSTIGDVAGANQEERRKMSDTDLSDDMLKLVRYKILFVKRDYEVAFREREELVHDNMTGEAFAAWKVAEFIQRLSKEEVPEKWRKKNYPRSLNNGDEGNGVTAYIERLDEDDKKYLRVYFEVLARYEREEANYDRDQIEVLKEIRNRL